MCLKDVLECNGWDSEKQDSLWQTIDVNQLTQTEFELIRNDPSIPHSLMTGYVASISVDDMVEVDQYSSDSFCINVFDSLEQNEEFYPDLIIKNDHHDGNMISDDEKCKTIKAVLFILMTELL